MPQYAYIKSYASPASQPYVLNVAGYVASHGTSVILWVLARQAPQNELWLFSSDGHIVSALDDQLVLGVDSSGGGWPRVELVTYAADDSSQLWDLVAAGEPSGELPVAQIMNRQSGQSLNVDGGSITNGASIITYTAGDSSNSLWTIEPLCVPCDQVTAIATAMSPPDSAPLCLNVKSSSSNPGTAPGTPVILEPLNINVDPSDGKYINNTNMMWSYTPDGFIESQLMPGLVLSLGPLVNWIYTVVVYPKQQWNNEFQQWAVSCQTKKVGDNDYTVLRFLNRQNGQLLAASQGATTGAGLITQWPIDGPQPNCDWIDVCGYPLEAIMTQAPCPYPPFAAGTPKYQAYAWISENVHPPAPMPPGLRGQYTSLDATSDYPTQIMGFKEGPPPAGVHRHAWTKVCDQLLLELAAVAPVQDLFTQGQSFLTTMQTQQGIAIEGLATAVGAGASTATVKANMPGAVQLTISALVNCAPGGFGAIAVILQTSLNDLVATRQVPATSDTVAAAKLQETLLTTYAAVRSNFSRQVSAIVSDWGKVQAVSRLTTLPLSHPDSLAITDVSINTAQGPAVSGYQVSVMQMLLPAVYQLFPIYQQENGFDWTRFFGVTPAGAPPTDAYWYQNGVPGGVYNFFAIGNGPKGTIESIVEYPTTETMDTYVWNLGQIAEIFYNAVGGWSNFPIHASSAGYGAGSGALLTTIVNCTPNTLTINVAPNHHCPLSWDNNTQSIGPYESISFALSSGAFDDTSANVSINASDYSGGPVMQFETNGGSNPSIGSPTPGATYFMHSQITNPTGDAPGFITVSIGENT